MNNFEDLNNIDNKRKRFLALISQLLCALYNMKKNSVKNNEPLRESELKDLLNSEIDIDEEGRPKAKAIVRPAYFVHETGKNLQGTGLIYQWSGRRYPRDQYTTSTRQEEYIQWTSIQYSPK